jgi:hypothetical protein
MLPDPHLRYISDINILRQNHGGGTGIIHCNSHLSLRFLTTSLSLPPFTLTSSSAPQAAPSAAGVLSPDSLFVTPENGTGQTVGQSQAA